MSNQGQSKLDDQTPPADEAGSKHEASSPANFTTRSRKDIVCGKGAPIGKHYGNFLLHMTINRYRTEYLNSRRKNKPIIIRQIVEEVKATGARFLLQVDVQGNDKWVEADDDYVYRKVSHALRAKNTGKTVRIAENDFKRIATADISAPTLNHNSERSPSRDNVSSVASSIYHLPERADLPIIRQEVASAVVSVAKKHPSSSPSVIRTSSRYERSRETSTNISQQVDRVAALNYPHMGLASYLGSTHSLNITAAGTIGIHGPQGNTFLPGGLVYKTTQSLPLSLLRQPPLPEQIISAEEQAIKSDPPDSSCL